MILYRFPHITGFKTVNRQCSSSLQSVTDVAQSIQSGMIDIGIAAGVEHMTRDYGTRAIPANISPFLKESEVEEARDCLLPMGMTSEAVADMFKITRKQQDECVPPAICPSRDSIDLQLLDSLSLPTKKPKLPKMQDISLLKSSRSPSARPPQRKEISPPSQSRRSFPRTKEYDHKRHSRAWLK